MKAWTSFHAHTMNLNYSLRKNRKFLQSLWQAVMSRSFKQLCPFSPTKTQICLSSNIPAASACWVTKLLCEAYRKAWRRQDTPAALGQPGQGQPGLHAETVPFIWTAPEWKVSLVLGADVSAAGAEVGVRYGHDTSWQRLITEQEADVPQFFLWPCVCVCLCVWVVTLPHSFISPLVCTDTDLLSNSLAAN